jgi:hypothetical protein
MKKMKRSLLLAMAIMTVSAFGFSTAASAAPAKKCPGENFQVVNGQCVSDGKAEHL